MPQINSKRLSDLILAGKLMSNWMFNLSQQDFLKDQSLGMKKMVKNWGQALGNLRGKP